MKIRLPSIRIKAKILIVLALIFMAVGVILVLNLKQDRNILVLYHQSAWNENVPYIESLFGDNRISPKVGLEHVYGGVVPHHIPTTIPKLIEFYSRLKKTQSVKNFIVIGPDHTDVGKGAITVSGASFYTAFGEVKPILGLAEKLENAKLANIEESPFDMEHSVGSQILIISKIFPDARVTPIILRSDTKKDYAEALGKTLAEFLDEETVLIASVDFSHYLATDQAIPIDQISGEVIRNLDVDAMSLVTADSLGSMEVFMRAMREKHATDADSVSVLNTNNLMQNNDYTTGYVFGYWGIKNSTLIKKEDDDTSTLVFVGDIMLSRAINNLMVKNNDWRYPFLKISDVLKNADLTFGNLEGPISDSGRKVGSTYSFRADPESVEGLIYSGFDVLSIANNHMWDYGELAFEDTLKILENNKIIPLGGGLSYEDAHTPVVVEVKGTKIAFLGYTNLLPAFLGLNHAKPAVAFPDKSQMNIDIKRAKDLVDIVVVSFHWGDEYEMRHNFLQEDLAHYAIDSGADLIIGHHPHVVQDVEEYNGGYIVYSLGNFVFDQNFSEDTKSGLILEVVLQDDKIKKFKPQKIEFTPSYQPFLVPQ